MEREQFIVFILNPEAAGYDSGAPLGLSYTLKDILEPKLSKYLQHKIKAINVNFYNVFFKHRYESSL